jgi:murein tripeptide amidase MpaA
LEKSVAGRKIMRMRESKNNESYRARHEGKKGVFITARVHPGESNSSFMVKGLIDYLISDCKDASFLRKKFIFKVVPMLNPDGVIYGNYRCSLLGVDLNRRWNKPNRAMHPTVYYTKKNAANPFRRKRSCALL